MGRLGRVEQAESQTILHLKMVSSWEEGREEGGGGEKEKKEEGKKEERKRREGGMQKDNVQCREADELEIRQNFLE